jgi:hypothetical protein
MNFVPKDISLGDGLPEDVEVNRWSGNADSCGMKNEGSRGRRRFLRNEGQKGYLVGNLLKLSVCSSCGHGLFVFAAENR